MKKREIKRNIKILLCIFIVLCFFLNTLIFVKAVDGNDSNDGNFVCPVECSESYKGPVNDGLNCDLCFEEKEIYEFQTSNKYIIELKEKPLAKQESLIEEQINNLENERASEEQKRISVSSAKINQLNSEIKTKEFEKEILKDKILNNHQKALNDIFYRIESEKGLASMSFWQNIINFFKKIIFRITGFSIYGNELELEAEFYHVFNGFVLSDISLEDVQKIKESPYVKNVYEDGKAHIVLMDSVPLIQNGILAGQLDEDGNDCLISGKQCLTGAGITIAVIDTGVDYTHPDLGGCFGAGCKVEGGYDFVNDDNDPMDDNGHGTHVAGTAAGSGVSGLKGVAPDAKIFSYKVCDNVGSCDFSEVIQGIEKAVLDDVDIISLSIGGSGHPDDSLSRAVDNAVLSGVVAVAAAGNKGINGEMTINSPGNSRKAITVGATNNDVGRSSDLYYNEIFIDSRGLDNSKIDSLLGIELKSVSGLGTYDDFQESGDFTDKIALIKRGDITFNEKVKNAYDAGAVGAIIYNNDEGNFKGVLTKELNIPAVSISEEDGLNLLNFLELEIINIDLSVSKNLSYPDFIASFSSRGPTSIYTIKPDVVAPGVYICSSQYDSYENNNKCYDDNHIAISGTSMATPHVSGVVALIKQAHTDWTPDEIKSSLRNTAVDLGYNHTEQGYGRVNVSAAIGLLDIPCIANIKEDNLPYVYENIDISGTAKCRNNFNNWVLEYGEGFEPDNWIEISSSFAQIDDDVLVSGLDTSILSYATWYGLRLRVTDINEKESEDRMYIFRTKPCLIIDTSGNYILNENKTCITVNADNASIDCDGYSINYEGNNGIGIETKNTQNVSINNCNIKGFSWGIYAQNVSLFKLTNSYIDNHNAVKKGFVDSCRSGSTAGPIVFIDVGSDVLLYNNTIHGLNNTVYGEGNNFMDDLHLCQVSNSTVDNNKIINYGPYPVFLFIINSDGVINSSNLTISNNYINSFAGHGIHIGNVGRFSNFKIINNTIMNPQYGFLSNNILEDSLILNNKALNITHVGFEIRANNSFFMNNIADNSMFTIDFNNFAQNDGFFMGYNFNSIYVNNTAIDFKQGFIITTSENVYFGNNSAYVKNIIPQREIEREIKGESSGGAFKCMYLTYDLPGEVKNLTCENNRFYNCDFGIDVNNASNSSFLNNEIENIGTGISIYSSLNNKFKNNTIKNASSNGFDIESSTSEKLNNSIENNYIESNDFGIDLSSATPVVYIINNTIIANNTGIIMSNTKDHTIKDNKIIANSIAIELGNSVENTFVNNNHLNASKGIILGPNFFNLTFNTTKTCNIKNIINGPCLGGNYYSDYNGNDSDNDGFGDTPYEILAPPPFNYARGYDYLPLVYNLSSECLPNLVNTSWTNWINASCFGIYVNQSRNKTQYDNNCTTANKTFYDFRLIDCNDNNEGTYDVCDGVLKLCENIVVNDDSDNDGVPDSSDRCPNTLPADINNVNIYGCPKPNVTGFDIISDLQNSDLNSLTEFRIGISNNGQLNFLENVSLIRDDEVIDLNSNINISHNKVEIKSSVIPELDKSAKISFYNTNLSSPGILRDGEDCIDCQINYWNITTGTLEINVLHFTVYELNEINPLGTRCGDGIINNNEKCDLNSFNEVTCQSFGYSSGVLSCYLNCTFNIKGCYNSDGGGDGGGGSSGGGMGGGGRGTFNKDKTNLSNQNADEDSGSSSEEENIELGQPSTKKLQYSKKDYILYGVIFFVILIMGIIIIVFVYRMFGNDRNKKIQRLRKDLNLGIEKGK